MATIEILLRLRDEASKQLEAANKKITDSAKNIRALGIGLSAFGAASMLFFGKAVKASAEEEAGIIRLSTALKNVGVSYDAVRGSLEKTIDATMRKTSVADDAQRAALAELVLMTGSYEKSLELLPMAIDLSVAKSIDLATASSMLGKAHAGNWEMLGRYIPELKNATSATEALGIISRKTAGQGEALGKSMQGSMAIIKNQIDDLMESIGATLVPGVTKLIKVMQVALDLFNKIPAPLRDAAVWAVAIAGGLAAIIGPVLLLISFLPKLAIGIHLVNVAMKALMGPVGLVLLGITALMVGIAWLIENWDKVKAAFGFGGGGGMAVPAMPTVPAMAGGGIITRPTLAMIGEKGPEAVVPLGSSAAITTLALQAGGIVTKPTLAMIGERGPEAVMPLGKTGDININISSNAFMGSESEARAWARKIGEYLRETNRTTSYGRLP